MSRCINCHRIFIGYSDLCILCQYQADHAERVEYDERQTREWASIMSQALHGRQVRHKRRWRIA